MGGGAGVRPWLLVGALCREQAVAYCGRLTACLPAAQVEAEKRRRQGEAWPAEEEAAFRQKIAQRYDQEGSPYYASARLWDDGVSGAGQQLHH